MSRIFVGLAALNTGFLVATFTIGFFAEGREGLASGSADAAALWPFTVHFLLGLFTTLLTLLVHSLAFTYFIGTGRWVDKVVSCYSLPRDLWNQSRSLKMRALPAILGGIFLVFAATMLGAAVDRGLVGSTLHMTVAMAAILFNLWSYLREYRALSANGGLIDYIMGEVKRMRRERGLE
jgi:hypothetical protein